MYRGSTFESYTVQDFICHSSCRQFGLLLSLHVLGFALAQQPQHGMAETPLPPAVRPPLHAFLIPPRLRRSFLFGGVGLSGSTTAYARPSMVDASLASRDHRRGPPNCGKLPNAGQHEPELTCWVVAGQLLRWSRVVTSTRQGRSGEEQGDGSSVGERKQWREMI